MSIQIENLGALKRKVRIVFPVQDIVGEKAYRLKQVAQNFTRPGFRRGKVPLSMIEKELGQQLNAEAAANKAGSLFFDICKDQKIAVAGKPDFKDLPEENERYSFDVEFEVMPEVPVLSAEHFKDLEFKDYQCNIDEQEIDRAVKLLQKMIGGKKEMPADYIMQSGDIAHIIFNEASVDGEVTDELLPLAKEIEVDFANEQSPIVQLTDQLVGKGFGEHAVEYISNVTAPSYEKLLNKTIKVNLTIVKAFQPIYAELNEEFFKKVGAADLATLRQDMQKNLELQVKNNVKNLSTYQITKAIKAFELEVPEVLIEEQAKAMREDLMAELKKQPSMELMYRVMGVKQAAQTQLKLTFFFSEFVKANKITVSPESIREKINEIASTYENPQEIKRLCLQNQEMIEGLQTNILEELAFEKIKEILPNKEVKNVSVTDISTLMREMEVEAKAESQRLGSEAFADENTDVDALEAEEKQAPIFASADTDADTPAQNIVDVEFKEDVKAAQ